MRQQHVDRPAGRMGNAIGYQPVAGRRNVRTAHAREALPARVQKSRDEVRQPIRIRISVIIDIGDNFTGSLHQPGIARVAQAAVGCA